MCKFAPAGHAKFTRIFCNDASSNERVPPQHTIINGARIFMIDTSLDRDEPNDTEDNAAAAVDALLNRALEGVRVLLVEDDDGLRGVASMALDRLGGSVVACPDGETALAELDSGEPFDLLFTDIDLGAGRNGFDVALQARRRDRRIAVVMTSACRSSVDHAKLIGAACAVVPKPYPLPDLIAGIMKARAGVSVSRRDRP
jgi:CheY-like chemotaxis protein